MLESGRSIADYRIVKPLAENPLFETYQVTGPGIESAKLLLLSAAQLVEKKSQRAFTAQAQVLLEQAFPGQGNLIAAEITDEYAYCLYPFVFGGALEEQLTENLPVRRTLEIIKAAAVQLSQPHAIGLWHGAISPATIYLDAGTVYFDQFALASLIRLDFQSGIDPAYCSPELVRGEPLGPATDLYSLGIVLYRMLTGAVPFAADGPFATAMLHVQESPVCLPDHLSLLQPLLDKLLAAVPGERLTASELVADIDRYLPLPQLDNLMVSIGEESVIETGLPVVDAEPSKIEALMDESDLTARIEQRLQQRAEVLYESNNLTKDAKRASTARMSAISKQSYRKKQDMMNHQQQQPKRSVDRYLLLVAVGVAVGVLLYLALLDVKKDSQPQLAGFPEGLLAGLEIGSKQLQQGDIVAAEKTFSSLVDDFAPYPQPYNNLAAIYARQGNLERSRSLLEKAMATDEYYATVYRNLGTVYSEMARDSYGRALQLEQGQQSVALQLFGADESVAVNATGSEQVVSVAAQSSAEISGPQPAVVAAQPSSVEDPVGSGAPAQTEPKTATAAEPATVASTATIEETGLVGEVVPAQEPEAADAFLHRWAAAWSAQDVPAYLSFYAEDYLPSAGISREEWAKQREDRLTRPKSIEIRLEDITLLLQREGRLQLGITQGYKSDRFSDRTRKIFDLVKDDMSWKIVRERSLGRVR